MTTGSRLTAGLPPWRRQAAILSDRYLDTLLGDIPTLLLLIAQAPVIAVLCVVVWSGIERDTESLYFVLALTAVWFGCINACREIVKERSIFERERLIGLSASAYVLSKAQVLAGLDFVQVAILLGIVEWKIGLRGSLFWQALALLLCAVCGTGLGLLISTVTTKQERAVAAVPLLILPQILFSEFTIPRQYFGHVSEWCERFMIVKWGYRIFVEAAKTDVGYLWILGSVLILIVMAGALLALSAAILGMSRGEEFL